MWLVIVGACGGSSATIDAPVAADAAVPPPDAAPTLSLRFDRTPGSVELDAIATLEGASTPVTLSADHGALGATQPTATGGQAHLVPAGTGAYTITATAGALTVSRVALVIGSVDEAWNQPEPVRGLANTPGWEDGPSISPDGSVLTFQYVAVSISCLLDMQVGGPACKIVGPVDAPARPRMPGASRVNADGTYVNGCPSIGVPTLTNFVPPNSLYSLHRAPDGSFGDPHPIYYAGADGCIGAFGLQLTDDAGGAVYALDNPVTNGAGARVFLAHLDPTADVVLGTFANVGGQLELDGHIGTMIGDPDGVQGNPNLWTDLTGNAVVLFSDDESGRQDLFFNDAAAATGPYAGQTLIPPPVSAAGVQESQPFFDGHTLYYRRDLVVLATDWNGAAMSDAASWTAPRTILAPGTGETDVGTVPVVGEPSVTTTAPAKELYFVYGRRVADGTLDLDLAMVPAR